MAKRGAGARSAAPLLLSKRGRSFDYGTALSSHWPVRLYIDMSCTTHGPPSAKVPPGIFSHLECPSTNTKLLPPEWRGGSYGLPFVSFAGVLGFCTPGITSRQSV